MPCQQGSLVIEESSRSPSTNTISMVNKVHQGSKIPVGSLPLFILPIAGETEEILNENLQTYIKYLKENPQTGLADLAFSIGKEQSPDALHRIAVIGQNSQEILEKLETSDFERGQSISSTRPKLCFVFPGNGSCYHNMGLSLYNTSPVFRSAFDEVDLSLQEKHVIYGEDKELVRHTNYSCAVSFHVNIALWKLWDSWGLKPDCVLGQSYGDSTAAVCASVTTLQAMTESIRMTREVCSPKVPPGMMLCLCADEKKVSSLIEAFGKEHPEDEFWVDIAVLNSNSQTIVAGSPQTIPLFSTFCQNNGLRPIPVPVEQAFHSRDTRKIIPDIRKVVANLHTREPTCDYFSSVVGGKFDPNAPGIEDYWVNHPSQTCRFKGAATQAYFSGARTFLEIGAHPVTSALVMQNVDEIGNSNEISCLPSLRKGREDWSVMLDSLARLWTEGHAINWRGFYEPYEGRIIPLPNIKSYTSTISQPSIIHKDATLTMTTDAFWTSMDSCNTTSAQTQLLAKYMIHQIKIVLKLRQKESLGMEDDLKDLGMDSLMAIQLKGKLQRLFGPRVSLSVNDMFGCHTVGELVERVHAVIFHDVDQIQKKRDMIELCKQDAHLWPHIKANGPPTVGLDEVKTLLLTGATGNLGPYMLEWLTKMENRPQTSKIYCLVRDGKTAEDSATKRLEKHLREMGMLDRIDMSKISVVGGNIQDELMGMGKEVYEKLAEEVEAVINCAVTSNHVAEYVKEDLKYGGVRAVNVIGAQRVFEFAAHSRTKWVYHGTTALTMWDEHRVQNGKILPLFPEEWPDTQSLADEETTINFGYGLSKMIADDIAGQAVQRGIPIKAMCFPKINGDTRNGRQSVMQNHFFVKFLYYIASGQMPDFDVPLQLLPVDTSADVSLKVFFNPSAASGLYAISNPHPCSEFAIGELVTEFGPQLRILVEMAKLVSKEGEEKVRENWKKLAEKGPLKKLSEQLDKEYPNWLDDPSKVFEDERVLSYLQEEYGYRLEQVAYEDFLQTLSSEGEDSLLFNWIEFYTREDCIFKLGAKGIIPLQTSWTIAPKTFFKDLKVAKLYPNIKELIEHPMTTMRRDIKYTIRNAKDIFLNGKH